MMQHYHYSLTEIDEMMPWEREIYVSMLQQHIEDENLSFSGQGSKRTQGDSTGRRVREVDRGLPFQRHQRGR